jgi:hypothetical protein
MPERPALQQADKVTLDLVMDVEIRLYNVAALAGMRSSPCAWPRSQVSCLSRHPWKPSTE